MRRTLGLAGLGTFGVLAAVVAMMVASGGPDVPPDMRIVVPQAENTELAMPRPSTVDIPEIPHAAATTEISTPPVSEQAKPAAKPRQTSTPRPAPPATQAPPSPSADDTVTQYPWWLQYYYYTGGGYGSGSYGGSAGRYGGGGGGHHR
ncbi:hypothetical protein [Actinocrispum sp. NPDC049592]|uniref:hypothetical protein n=1 Tax=Actinocrispum sp. NPDC049592 TaxID=3154835 RepID=UPI00341B5564